MLFDRTVETVCFVLATFVQYFRESLGRTNWLCDTAIPEPILGRRWAHLECMMDYLNIVAIPHVHDNLKQVVRLFNRIFDHAFGLVKSSRRCCCFETWTRYVPGNKGGFLKALESDVGLLQELPMNCEQRNQSSDIYARCNNKLCLHHKHRSLIPTLCKPPSVFPACGTVTVWKMEQGSDVVQYVDAW